MLSLKSDSLFSLFNGVSFADVQRAATHRDPGRHAEPSPQDVARATRFAAPSQISAGTLVAA